MWFLQIPEPRIRKSQSLKEYFSILENSLLEMEGGNHCVDPQPPSGKGKHLEVKLNASLLFSHARSPRLCTHTPLGSSELFWAPTSSAFHIRLGVNYDASVKTSLLTVSGSENGRRDKGSSNYRLLALINAHLLRLVF